MQGLFIDKLPFPVPTEPLFEAMSEQIEELGESAFFNLSIPIATLKIKQGSGRLIRKENDKGYILIADKRLLEKQYGQGIIRALPNFNRIRTLPKI